MRTGTRLMILAWIFVLLSCGKSSVTSTSSSLSPGEAKRLRDALAHLETVLAAKAPAIHARLASPASPAEIATLRAGLNGTTVETLEIWFSWHNGSSGSPAEFLPLGEMISIDEALADRNGTAKIRGASGIRKSSIKILEDGFGDGYFLDLTLGKPLVFFDMLEEPGPMYFGTLAEFVRYIADCFDAGIVFVDPAGEFDWKEDAIEVAEENFLRTATQP